MPATPFAVNYIICGMCFEYNKSVCIYMYEVYYKGCMYIYYMDGYVDEPITHVFVIQSNKIKSTYSCRVVCRSLIVGI